MATWVAHMRIAERLLNKFSYLDSKSFLVGNIGPDCGVPNSDWSEFNPSKNVSHWHDTENKINAEDFKSKYLKESSIYNICELSFYLGYYCHLLSDIEWNKFFRGKKQEPIYKDNLERDPKFIWTIKEDWYGLDHLYLRENRDCIFFKEFININEFPNKYFDFYPKEAFERQIKYISEFYLTFNENLDRPFVYLTKEEMDGFVDSAVREIDEKIKCLPHSILAKK